MSWGTAVVQVRSLAYELMYAAGAKPNQQPTTTKITGIYVNGGKADALYRKYCEPQTGRKAVRLPSTSPANAAWDLERLLGDWKIVMEGMK